MITQTYTLSLQPGGAPLRIPCVQRDANSRDITFDLTSGGVAFSPPDGAVVTFDGTKPDGKSFSTAGAISGTKITVTLSQQMTAVAGDVPCQLTITSGTAVLGTARFILAVSEAAIPTDPDLSTSDMSVFETLKNAAAQSAITAAEQATAAANSATAAAAAVSGKADLAVPAAAGNLAKLTAQGNLADAGFAVSMGTWTPSVSGAGSYDTQSGSYLKIGNVVVLQFYVYGTFAGSATEKITIKGCPFSPAAQAAGGGSLSGYTAGANIVFSGWAISTAGNITPRGQEVGTTTAWKWEKTEIYQTVSNAFSASGTIAFRVN
nr:MAG TPA: BppU domain protein [Caudoviricetes sp.]